jgi:hypothetical protein
MPKGTDPRTQCSNSLPYWHSYVTKQWTDLILYHKALSGLSPFSPTDLFSSFQHSFPWKYFLWMPPGRRGQWLSSSAVESDHLAPKPGSPFFLGAVGVLVCHADVPWGPRHSHPQQQRAEPCQAHLQMETSVLPVLHMGHIKRYLFIMNVWVVLIFYDFASKYYLSRFLRHGILRNVAPRVSASLFSS